MPDPDQTGYVSLSSKLEDFFVDISLFGESDKKINGTLTFQN
jgi:hypothetical protein